jgi:protein-L-isoaspartate(D-aspartate) O-methyltransferase
MNEIEKAFRLVDRANFIPEDLHSNANIDAPLPIGFGQTISQPTTVRMMLEWLRVQVGNKILDIGAGSGWTSALIASMVGPTGRVYAVERIPELVEFGRDNVRRNGIENVEFYQSAADLGLPQYAPYDRILVSAAAQKLPKRLIQQLKVGGIMVIPIRNDIIELKKNSQTGYLEYSHPGFTFVPLILG